MPTVVVQQQGCTVEKVFLYFLRFLKVVAILALIADIVAYCLSMKGAIESNNIGNYSKSFFVLSSIGFCLLALSQMVAELEPSWFMSRFRFMKWWAVRGFLLGWQGIQTISSAEVIANSVTDVGKESFRTAGDVVGWTLIAIGALYILMSTLCLKKLCGLSKPDEIQVRIISDEDMNRIGTTVGISEDYDRERAKQSGGGKQLLSPEARTIISNMAIALDITSSKAWDLFNGPAGAEEARRIRNERNDLANAATQHVKDRFDDYQPPAAPVMGTASGGYTPHESNAPAANNSKKGLNDADLEAQYYASLN